MGSYEDRYRRVPTPRLVNDTLSRYKREVVPRVADRGLKAVCDAIVMVLNAMRTGDSELTELDKREFCFCLLALMDQARALRRLQLKRR